jgi:hypothetical protein
MPGPAAEETFGTSTIPRTRRAGTERSVWLVFVVSFHTSLAASSGGYRAPMSSSAATIGRASGSHEPLLRGLRLSSRESGYELSFCLVQPSKPAWLAYIRLFRRIRPVSGHRQSSPYMPFSWGNRRRR